MESITSYWILIYSLRITFAKRIYEREIEEYYSSIYYYFTFFIRYLHNKINTHDETNKKFFEAFRMRSYMANICLINGLWRDEGNLEHTRKYYKEQYDPINVPQRLFESHTEITAWSTNFFSRVYDVFSLILHVVHVRRRFKYVNSRYLHSSHGKKIEQNVTSFCSDSSGQIYWWDKKI